MDPFEYVRAVRRRWKVVVAALGVALLAGLIVSRSPAPTTPEAGSTTVVYEATTILLFTGTPEITGFYNLRTIATLATVGEVPERLAKAAGFEGDPALLGQQLQAKVEPETGLLKLTTTGSDAEQARTLADTFAKELVGFLRDKTQQEITGQSEILTQRMDQVRQEIADIEAQMKGASETDRFVLETKKQSKSYHFQSLYEQFQQVAARPTEPPLSVVQKASAQPMAQESPRGFVAPKSRGTKMGLAAVVGLLAGVGLALVLDRVDTRIRDRQEAETHYGLPVLAEIPVIPRRRRARDIVQVTAWPKSAWADSFRLLAAAVARHLKLEGEEDGKEQARPLRLEVGGDGRDAAKKDTAPLTFLLTRGGGADGARTVLVTSSGPHDGKTTVVANLAATFAELGRRVLVVSCDFRRPRIHETLGVENEPGLAEALRTRHHEPVLAGIVRRTSIGGVHLVPSGPVPDKPSQLLGSENMKRALREARAQADVVLLDTAPIFSSDAANLLPEVDAVLLVARAGRTRAEVAERTSEVLKRLGARVMGVALTCSAEAGMPGGARYEYYRSGGGRRGLPEIVRALRGR